MKGHHEQFGEREDVKLPSEKSFGITFAVVLSLLSLWLYWRKGLPQWSLVTLIVAGGFLAAGFLWPVALRPLNRLWMKFGLLLHKIINPIVMGLLFFLVFTPTAVIMRALGKDFMRLKRAPGTTSYWIARSPETDPPSNMKNQY